MFGKVALSYLEPIIIEHIKSKILKSIFKFLSASGPFATGFSIFFVMNQKLNASTRSEKTVL